MSSYDKMTKVQVVALLESALAANKLLEEQIIGMPGPMNPVPDDCVVVPQVTMDEYQRQVRDLTAQLAAAPSLIEHESQIAEFQQALVSERTKAADLINEARREAREARKELANRPAFGIDKIVITANGGDLIFDLPQQYMSCTTDESYGPLVIDPGEHGGTVLTIDLPGLICDRQSDNQPYLDPPPDHQHPVYVYISEREMNTRQAFNQLDDETSDVQDGGQDYSAEPQVASAIRNAQNWGRQQQENRNRLGGMSPGGRVPRVPPAPRQRFGPPRVPPNHYAPIERPQPPYPQPEPGFDDGGMRPDEIAAQVMDALPPEVVQAIQRMRRG